jgi:hypothetical protein
VKLVIHYHTEDGTTVEAGGLLAAADLLVDARRQYRASRSVLDRLDRGLVAPTSDGRLCRSTRGTGRLRDGPVGLNRQ